METEKATDTGFDSNQSEDEQFIPKKLIFIEYRGKSQEIVFVHYEKQRNPVTSYDTSEVKDSDAITKTKNGKASKKPHRIPN